MRNAAPASLAILLMACGGSSSTGRDSVVAEYAGAHCTSGGEAIAMTSMGVTVTSYVCDGAPASALN